MTAKAGIQAEVSKDGFKNLDSRFRGNECGFLSEGVKEEERAGRGSVKRFSLNLGRNMQGSKIMGGVLLMVGLFVCYQGLDLTLGTPNRPGPGFVPFGLGLLLLILAGVYLWQNRGRKEERKSAGGNYGRTALAVGILCFYAIAVSRAGYILTTFFSFILWLSLIERKGWVQTASLACLAAIGIYAFNVLFSIQLPAGLLKGVLR